MYIVRLTRQSAVSLPFVQVAAAVNSRAAYALLITPDGFSVSHCSRPELNLIGNAQLAAADLRALSLRTPDFDVFEVEAAEPFYR
jgi:hypothetical protein